MPVEETLPCERYLSHNIGECYILSTYYCFIGDLNTFTHIHNNLSYIHELLQLLFSCTPVASSKAKDFESRHINTFFFKYRSLLLNKGKNFFVQGTRNYSFPSKSLKIRRPTILKYTARLGKSIDMTNQARVNCANSASVSWGGIWIFNWRGIQ